MAPHADEVVHLPVIDISDPTLAVGKEMIAAAAKYGFLYIDTNGTGFTEEIVDKEFAIGQKFFSLSDSEKAESTINETNRGWTGMHTEILDPKNQRKGDFKEALNIGEFVNSRPEHNFPKALSPHIAELAEFENIAKSVRDRILDLLAMGLEIPDQKFFSSHGPVRMHHATAPLPISIRRRGLSTRRRHPGRRPQRLRLHHTAFPKTLPTRSGDPNPRKQMGTRPRLPTQLQNLQHPPAHPR